VSGLLAPAAWIFRAGVACRSAAYRRQWLSARHLRQPVVSVGNLSVGGTGKTPFVEYLAKLLVARGRKPAILTRGYRRKRSADLVVIESASRRSPDPRVVGDEPALLARRLPCVPIVVSADRYRAGRVAEERFEVDTHILDDGFQHLGLARTLDIVLLDATEDYDAGLLPVGRLREPLSALARAQVVILTRTKASAGGLGDPAERLEPQAERIQTLATHWAPNARLFRAVTESAGAWTVPDDVNPNGGAIHELPLQACFAFCGVGNPQAFFRDLQGWGVHLAGQRVFPDHHRYSPKDLADLEKAARASGAAAILTTEKDAMNLLGIEPGGLPILACPMNMRLAEEEAFEEALFSILGGVALKAS